MTTLAEFYEGYDRTYESGDTFTIGGIGYALVSVNNSEHIVINTTTYQSIGRCFGSGPVKFSEIKQIVNSNTADIVPGKIVKGRRLPVGSVIVSNDPETGRELMLILDWDTANMNGTYYFVNTSTGMVECRINKSPTNTGINANQFSMAAIGDASIWELVKT